METTLDGKAFPETEGTIIKDEAYWRIQDMCLFSDLFMKHFFYGQKEIAEKMLRIIMERDDIHVRSFSTQKEIPNLLGRSVCLDMECEDDEGIVYDIEVQSQTDISDLARRCRFYAAVETLTHLPKGKRGYRDLNESVVIFILRQWPGRKGEPLYHIERCIKEKKDEKGNNRPFGDGDHIILVNGELTDRATDLGRLMHDFSCARVEEMEYDWLRGRMSQVKNSREAMMDISIEDQARYEKGWAKAREEMLREMVLGMLQNGADLEFIMKVTKKPRECIEKILKEDASRA